jgi:3-oxoacyl-[acyl-carrier-protein] synthase II
MDLKRVVVTGIGTINPLGHSKDEFWEKLEEGASGSEMITLFDSSKFKTKFACEVKNYDATDYFDRKEARKLDRYAQFALIAAEEAYKDANLENADLDLDRSGVIWASGIGGIETLVS